MLDSNKPPFEDKDIVSLDGETAQVASCYWDTDNEPNTWVQNKINYGLLHEIFHDS